MYRNGARIGMAVTTARLRQTLQALLREIVAFSVEAVIGKLDMDIAPCRAGAATIRTAPPTVALVCASPFLLRQVISVPSSVSSIKN